MIRKLQCWLVSGTAGPSRRQTSLHRIHEYVLHTAWPLDNRCETLQLGSSFCFYSCHLAVVGLGWSQWVNLGTIKGKARVTHIPALTFSCSWDGEEQESQPLLLFGTPALEAAILALYSYHTLPEVSVFLWHCRYYPWYCLTSLVWGSKSKLLS